MQQLLEYITRHPLLVGITAAIALAALAYELSRARAGGQSVGPAEAIRLLNQGAACWTSARATSSTPVTSSTPATCRRATWTVQPSRSSGAREGRDRVLRERTRIRRRRARALRALGFTQVATLRGGLQNWKAENLPLVKSDAQEPMTTSAADSPDVVMYSTTWCPFCERARALLDRKSVTYREIKIDEDPDQREEMLARAAAAGARSRRFSSATARRRLRRILRARSRGRARPPARPRRMIHRPCRYPKLS